MPAAVRKLSWTSVVPVLALVLLIGTFGRSLPDALVVIVAVLLIGAVLAAVHHAEVVAHRVGEPFGSLILAVAVTVIEVGLIVTLMVSGGEKDTSTLARDTVFSAVMLSVNGIVGISLLVSALKHRFAVFNPEGTGAALATVIAVTTVCLVVPRFTTSAEGPRFDGAQLAFAGVASLLLYGLFVFTQTVRHRDFFLPVAPDGTVRDVDDDGHADPPSDRETLVSLGLLVIALLGVVGLAKVASPSIESGVAAVGFPHEFVGVIIAALVLLPEGIAATRNALDERVQVSLNLGYGSAIASVGLTIPVIALASIWLDGPLSLGLEPLQIVLLATSALVGTLTVVPGRAKSLQGGLHLVLMAAFVFLSIRP